MIVVDKLYGPGADALAEALKEALAPYSHKKNIRIDVLATLGSLYVDVDRAPLLDFLDILSILQKVGVIEEVFGANNSIRIDVKISDDVLEKAREGGLEELRKVLVE